MTMAFSLGAMSVSNVPTSFGIASSSGSIRIVRVLESETSDIGMLVSDTSFAKCESAKIFCHQKRDSFRRCGCQGRHLHLPNAMLASRRSASNPFSFQPAEGKTVTSTYLNLYSAICSVRQQPEGSKCDGRGHGSPYRSEALGKNDAPELEGATSSDSDPNDAHPQVSTLAIQPVRDSPNPRVGSWITAILFLLCGGTLVALDLAHSRVKLSSAGSFVLTSPFMLSAATTTCLGYLVVPVLKHLKAAQILRIEGPTAHVVKSGTPTLGGLFFIPMGVAVAGFTAGVTSVEVKGAVMVTFAMFAVGLMDDCLAFLRNHNHGLPGPFKLLCQVLVGIALFMWSEYANLVRSNKLEHMMWLPAPFGVLNLGKWYLPLTAFCCAAMSNGVNLTDGLDGLAAGTVAIALIAMSAIVSPTLPALGGFGSSMAGACLGFLVHNKYKAKVFMGDTGSLALGGCLAAMAHGTGMFVPLFIASGIFVIETLSVIGQVMYFKFTKKYYGKGRRWLRMAPFHHHLELLGFSEPVIVVMAYTLSALLGCCAVYILQTHGVSPVG